MRKIALIMTAAMLIVFTAGCGDTTDKSVPAGTNPAAAVIGTQDKVLPIEDFVQDDSMDELGFQLEKPQAGEEIAVITLKSGDVIKLRFFPNEAPLAVYNFKNHALNGYYDGVSFHRIESGFMIQGGDPTATGSGGESVWGGEFKDEFSKKLINIDGSVAMANYDVDTNGSQFFINNTDNADINWEYQESAYEMYAIAPEAFIKAYPNITIMDMEAASEKYRKLYDENGGNPSLDGGYRVTGGGHTVFAQVFEGMDTVKKLSQTSRADDTTGITIMKTVEIVTY